MRRSPPPPRILEPGNSCALLSAGAVCWRMLCDPMSELAVGHLEAILADLGLILDPSWAILGPLGLLLGRPRGHLEAKFGLGRLDLGVQGSPKLRCQNHQKPTGNQCFWLISGGKEPSESLQSGSLELLLWARRLEEGSSDAKLASNLAQQGNVTLKFNQTWFRELASWEQLDVRWLGKLENCKNLFAKTIVF